MFFSHVAPQSHCKYSSISPALWNLSLLDTMFVQHAFLNASSVHFIHIPLFKPVEKCEYHHCIGTYSCLLLFPPRRHYHSKQKCLTDTRMTLCSFCRCVQRCVGTTLLKSFWWGNELNNSTCRAVSNFSRLVGCHNTPLLVKYTKKDYKSQSRGI